MLRAVDTPSIAVVSVLSSAAVAVLATGSQLWIALSSRSESRRSRIEERLWDQRVDVLTQVARVAIRAQQVAGGPEEEVPDPNIVKEIQEVARVLRGELATAMAMYGPERVRSGYMALVRSFAAVELTASPQAWAKVSEARRQKESALDASDFEQAAEARQRERGALTRIGFVGGSLYEAERLATEVLDAVRDELWSPSSYRSQARRGASARRPWRRLRRDRRVRHLPRMRRHRRLMK